MPWSRRFEVAITIDGAAITTLRQAADHILSLPAAAQAEPHWQIATEMIIAAAEDRRPLMFASIALRRALGHGAPAPATAPRRKRVKAYRIIR